MHEEGPDHEFRQVPTSTSLVLRPRRTQGDRYHCFRCSIIFVREGDGAAEAEVRCPSCGDGFVEQLDTVARDPGFSAGIEDIAVNSMRQTLLRELRTLETFLNEASVTLAQLQSEEEQQSRTNPVPASAVEKLREFRVTDETLKDSDKCPVCVCEWEVGKDMALELPCKHIFHPICVKKWFNRQNTCPLCRAPVGESEREAVRTSGGASGGAGGEQESPAGSAAMSLGHVLTSRANALASAARLAAGAVGMSAGAPLATSASARVSRAHPSVVEDALVRARMSRAGAAMRAGTRPRMVSGLPSDSDDDDDADYDPRSFGLRSTATMPAFTTRISPREQGADITRVSLGAAGDGGAIGHRRLRMREPTRGGMGGGTVITGRGGRAQFGVGRTARARAERPRRPGAMPRSMADPLSDSDTVTTDSDFDSVSSGDDEEEIDFNNAQRRIGRGMSALAASAAAEATASTASHVTAASENSSEPRIPVRWHYRSRHASNSSSQVGETADGSADAVAAASRPSTVGGTSRRARMSGGPRSTTGVIGPSRRGVDTSYSTRPGVPQRNVRNGGSSTRTGRGLAALSRTRVISQSGTVQEAGGGRDSASTSPRPVRQALPNYEAEINRRVLAVSATAAAAAASGVVAPTPARRSSREPDHHVLVAAAASSGRSAPGSSGPPRVRIGGVFARAGAAAASRTPTQALATEAADDGAASPSTASVPSPSNPAAESGAVAATRSRGGVFARLARRASRRRIAPS